MSLAQNYLSSGEPVKTLHMVEVVLEGDQNNAKALQLRQQALELLLDAARAGLKNDYEIYWLQARLTDTAARLEAL